MTAKRRSTAAERMAKVTAAPSPPSRPPFDPELADAPPHPEEPTTTVPVIGEPDPQRATKDEGKVRTTVVLDSDEYNALRRFCLDVEGATGRRGVAGSEVMRVLLSLVQADANLRDRVTREIGTHGGNRRR